MKHFHISTFWSKGKKTQVVIENTEIEILGIFLYMK